MDGKVYIKGYPRLDCQKDPSVLDAIVHDECVIWSGASGKEEATGYVIIDCSSSSNLSASRIVLLLHVVAAVGVWTFV